MAHKSTNEESATRLLGLQKDHNTKLVKGNTSVDEYEWFLNLSQKTRRQLFEGNYELVSPSPVFTGKVFSGNIIKLFNEQKTGKDKQWHSEDFKKLLKSIKGTVNVSKTKIQKFVLEKQMSDFDIQDRIGLENLVHKSKADALATLHASMVDEYRDGNANIAYYLNESGEFCYACCRWRAFDVEWYCIAYSARANEWSVGGRVFSPAT